MAASADQRCAYHVFLSFRGGDTRKNFTDHLYTALVQAGIHTFRDDDEIERGEKIDVEIQKAIQESKISIIVLSKDYASSRWCLDELVKIMEQRRSVGQIVIPVFYDVDPSQVRNQTGSFAEAFARHEGRFKKEMEKVQRWRAALREVADLGGMVLQNRNESQFIQNIVQDTGNKLKRIVLNVTPYLVGTDCVVDDITMWLQDGSNDVGIATICGIGGIGKTTIAKIVYNQNFDRFERRSFLANVRETSAQCNGLIHLQKQLVSDLLKGKKTKIYSKDEGIVKIKDAICCRRVLLVVDDVDEVEQLKAIIGMRDWFYPGSKIIITTRYEELLRTHDICKKFKVKELGDNESFQLLSWHAFRRDYPDEGYMECSRNVVRHCGGLPLALQVLGSSLSGKSVNVWKSVLQKLKEIPDSKIQKILRISYDSLQDDHDKNLFLDIACFFVGKKKDYMVTILEGCGFYATVGIENLIDRCLLTVDRHNKLGMHQLIKDMCREIVRQESTEDPGKRSRLWHDKDAFNVLKEKTGTETIKGLTLDLRRLQEVKFGRKVSKRYHHEDSFNNSELLQYRNFPKRRCLDFFSWKPVHGTTRNSFPLSNDVDLKTNAFGKMRKLKLLHLNYVKLNGSYEEFPKSLVWLSWHEFPQASIPTTFCLEKLVALDMRASKLKHNWKVGKFLGELKILNLSHCHNIVKTPCFSGLPILEKLKLKYCINLVEIDDAIVDLQRLVFLNLEGCQNLRKLSRKIGLLRFLEVLILSGCSRFDKMPMELGKMESLRVLRADGTAINQSKCDTQSWYSIISSWAFPQRSTQSPSFSLAFLPRSLIFLSLEDCNLSDDAIPNDLSSLPFLQRINLRGNRFRRLPESINSLSSLDYLYVDGCRELQSLPELPMSLRRLTASYCTSLKRVTNLPNRSSEVGLDLMGCEKLIEVQGLFKLEPVTNTDKDIINNLGLFNLESIENIEVEMYNIFTFEERKAPLQLLHECGVSSIFVPGSEVPSWFNHHSNGSSISFDVPPLIRQNISGLNLCIVYGHKYKLRPKVSQLCEIIIETKSIKWSYTPSSFGIPGATEDMLWLSHWMFGDNLKVGEQVNVSVNMDSFKVVEFGIHLFYKPENKPKAPLLGNQANGEEIVQSTSSWHQTQTLIDRDASSSKNQWGTTDYFNNYCKRLAMVTWARW